MNSEVTSSEQPNAALPARPLCLVIAVLIPIVFLPLSYFLGRQFGDGTKEFGELIIMVPSYLVGVVLCWSLIVCGLARRERPRFVAVVAFILSVAPAFLVH